MEEEQQEYLKNFVAHRLVIGDLRIAQDILENMLHERVVDQDIRIQQ